MYDAASTILQQKLSQVEGVGQVFVGGSSLPAVRVELNPMRPEQIRDQPGRCPRAFWPAPTSTGPRGSWRMRTGPGRSRPTTSSATAEQYRPLIVTYRTGAAVRLPDVAEVEDSVEDLRTAGLVNGKPAVMVIIFRQPGANIIETVDRVRDLLPQLEAAMPGGIKLSIVQDRTPPIRGSLRDVERTLVISGILVILVVFGFLRNVRSTVIPAVAVAVSLIGTFGVMYLFGYNLDNLSLMALTIATGFVVDDAIVVLENITRYIEKGDTPSRGRLSGGPGDRLHGPLHEHSPWWRSSSPSC